MNKVKVLFVDDEINILNAINRSIMDEPIEVLLATSGEKALEFFKDNTIALIVSDMKMPNMSGLDLLRRVKEISPATVRIVLSGYNQLPQILATVNNVGVFRYITKPWNDEEDFLPAIREAIKYYNLASESIILHEKLEIKNKMYEKGLELNKNLVGQMSKSISNIKDVSKFMIKLQNTYLDNLKKNGDQIDNVCNYNELMGEVYLEYLNKSLVDKEKFSLSKFNQDLKKLIDQNVGVNIINPEMEYIGDYKLIKFIAAKSINFIINKFKIENIDIKINCDTEISLLIKNANINFYEGYKANYDMKLFFAMIDQILVTMNGKVNFYSDSVNEIRLKFGGTN